MARGLYLRPARDPLLEATLYPSVISIGVVSMLCHAASVLTLLSTCRSREMCT